MPLRDSDACPCGKLLQPKVLDPDAPVDTEAVTSNLGCIVCGLRFCSRIHRRVHMLSYCPMPDRGVDRRVYDPNF